MGLRSQLSRSSTPANSMTNTGAQHQVDQRHQATHAQRPHRARIRLRPSRRMRPRARAISQFVSTTALATTMNIAMTLTATPSQVATPATTGFNSTLRLTMQQRVAHQVHECRDAQHRHRRDQRGLHHPQSTGPASQRACCWSSWLEVVDETPPRNDRDSEGSGPRIRRPTARWRSGARSHRDPAIPGGQPRRRASPVPDGGVRRPSGRASTPGPDRGPTAPAACRGSAGTTPA